jgi:hypothetical protein
MGTVFSPKFQWTPTELHSVKSQKNAVIVVIAENLKSNKTIYVVYIWRLLSINLYEMEMVLEEEGEIFSSCSFMRDKERHNYYLALLTS